jgi:putative nucleotidyltransferase with HDIG domain
MLPENTILSPLVIDPDTDFLNSLKEAQSKQPKVGLFLAINGKDAQSLLSDTQKPVSAIFINPKIVDPEWIYVVRYIHQHRVGTPIYIICDGPPPVSEKELRQIGIQKVIQKPVTFDQIIQTISPVMSKFDANKALETAQNRVDPLDLELSTNDEDFVPIRAADFLSGSIAYFDLYVRIQAGKYVKILQAGDNFTGDRLSNYLSKGVINFYIRKEAQKHYITYCDQIATSLIKSSKVSLDTKTAQTLNHGEETLKYLEKTGIDPENIKLAVNFVHNVNSLLKQSELDKQPAVKGLLADATAYSHAVGVAMIAGLLVKSLKITSMDPVESVGLASLLHDIGLRHVVPPIDEEDESKMTDAQKAVYKTHPTVGAEILKNMRKLKPIVIQAVAQHHERRNKKGFPERIGAGSISMVAEVVGLSDEYLRILKKHQENPNLNVKFEVEHKIFSSFSPPLIAEFKKLFGFTSEEVVKLPS